jgi:hypothetical protein
MYPPAGMGDARSSGTQKVLQVLFRDLQHDTALLRHVLEGKKRQHPVSSTTLSPVSRSVYISPFSFTAVGKQATRLWEVMQEDVDSCRGGY